MKNESEKLDIITAYKELGSYRGAADLCGTSHKTVARGWWPPSKPTAAPA